MKSIFPKQTPDSLDQIILVWLFSSAISAKEFYCHSCSFVSICLLFCNYFLIFPIQPVIAVPALKTIADIKIHHNTQPAVHNLCGEGFGLNEFFLFLMIEMPHFVMCLRMWCVTEDLETSFGFWNLDFLQQEAESPAFFQNIMVSLEDKSTH